MAQFISKNKRQVFVEKLVIYTLLLIPLLFYSYLLLPIKDSVSILSYEFKTTYFADVQVFVWTLYLKLYVIVLLSIWFLTNNKWWRFAIIPILCYTTFQLVSVFNDELKFVNKINYWVFIIISFLAIPVFTKVHNYINYMPLSFSEKIENDTKEKLSKLIRFNKEKYVIVSNKLEELNNMKSEIAEKDFLFKLLAIQAEIEEDASTFSL